MVKDEAGDGFISGLFSDAASSSHYTANHLDKMWKEEVVA
jgi:hypothetical protein